MKKLSRILFSLFSALSLAACSVFGSPGVEIAPYDVEKSDNSFEVRKYKELVLVTTPMPGGMKEGGDEAFNRLFKYISGENAGAQEISMTAPVIMDEKPKGQKIEMTAPVFMDESAEKETMSFVLPAQYTYETAPKPTNPQVRLEKLENLKVASIRFSGFLNERNILKRKNELLEWMKSNSYEAVGAYRVAGYDPPWTIPFLRRNEVLIPVR
jgi:hypothetical protein